VSTQRSHQPYKALEKLELGIQYKLVLIVAPSGTGKAKLLRRWAQNRLATSPISTLWINIDNGDKHPSQFLSKLLSELMTWDPIIEDHIDLPHAYDQIQLENGSPESISIQGLHPSIEAFLMAIINRLIPLCGERFLILINYHCISNPEIHAIMAYIIDYLPPNFHLIITSQDYPPLQFPRLRVRRELLEIGPEDMN
jgi:LuxR family maltose regulon positive regulatory protein